MNLISAKSRLYISRITTPYSYERMHSYHIYSHRKWIFYTWIKTSNSFIYESQTYHISFYIKIKSKP